MLMVLVRRDGNGTQGQHRQGAAPARPSQDNRRPGIPDPERARQAVLANPAAQQQLREQKPELYAALNDAGRWRDAFLRSVRESEEAERERQNQLALLNEDPFNPENQRKIEEIIRQERVMENLQHAYEHTPEGRLQLRNL